MDQTYGPYFTTRSLNVKQIMEVVDSNTGMMYVSGQHNPMGWDSLMVGIYLIAEKLGKDPIEIATLNLHGPESQTDPNPVPSMACVAVKRCEELNRPAPKSCSTAACIALPQPVPAPFRCGIQPQT
jgi:hypothetical protein